MPPARRVFAALFAPWFAVVTAEPTAVHECAMHSPVAAHAAAAAAPDAPAAAQGMAHDHAAMMHHGGGMALARSQQAPTSQRHGSHICSCPDGCCAASPVAVQPEATLSWVPAFVLRVEPPFHAAPAPSADADHVLPFANGPPARS